MKTMKVVLVMALMVMSTTVFGKKKTEEFKVYGNCGMCETRIEKAAGAVEGVIKAVWNQETNMLEVKIDTKKAELLDVHKAVAKAGHDTDLVRAKDDVYAKLHSCCKYDRPGEKEEVKKEK